MPTYQYVCTKCGHDLEARQSFSDTALTDCPSCGVGDALRKQFGSVGVVFKGSGFYRNDSRSSSGKELSKNDSAPGNEGGESKSESTSETKSESKSESTSESKSDAKPKTESKKTEKAASAKS